MWSWIKQWFNLGKVETPPVDPLQDAMQQMLVQADRLHRLLEMGTWKGRRPNWRTSKVTSVYPNIFHLIRTVRSTINAVLSRTKPSLETRISRKFRDNLTTVTLDLYLMDDHGMTCPPQAIFRELLSAVRDLTGNLNELEKQDANYHDYYMRQCSNLFVELEIIIKAYL